MLDREREDGREMDVALGVLVGLALSASAFAATRLLTRHRGVFNPERQAMHAGLHAAVATLPHLSKGLSAGSAQKAAPDLRALIQSPAIGIADREQILAWDGEGSDHHRPGSSLSELVATDPGHDGRLRVESLLCEKEDCFLGAAVIAPLVVQDRQVGSLIGLFRQLGSVSPEDTRGVEEAARLVSAQLALAGLADQERRIAQAELRALRAQISPHFIYNALAAVGSYIHTNPEEARELLSEFAEFTRYAFQTERSYVTLAEELRYVEKYLSLERARFGDRLEVRLEVPPEVLQAPLPVLSLQPLVENAVRHGVEGSASPRRIEVLATDLGRDVEVRVSDDGAGMDPREARAALAGAGRGIGLFNVNERMLATFGDGYGLDIHSAPGEGTTVTMTLPKSLPGARTTVATS
jgi:two-component system, LytTR family, sensor kinase